MNNPGSLFDTCVRTMDESASQTIMNKGKNAGYGAMNDAVRYFSEDPIYSALWMISGAEGEERQYSPPHEHDYPELNIIAGAPGELVYRIRIADEEREVESPATILIPAGVTHSANLVRGTGAYVVFRLDPEQLAIAASFAPKVSS